MSDLIFNFEITPNPINRPSKQSTPGNWTHKLKEKRKAKWITKRINNNNQSKSSHPPPPPFEPETSTLPDTESHQRTIDDDDDDGRIRKKSRYQSISTSKEQKNLTPNKLQYISSLFSSTIIPKIILNEEKDIPITIFTPSLSSSNSILSDISIKSNSLNIHPKLIKHLSNCKKLGPILSPTGIQSISWPLLNNHQENIQRDIIIQSQTGSGKTLSYLLPIIQDLLLINQNHHSIKFTREIGTLAIILVPTRELAEQVTNVAINLLSFSNNHNNESKEGDGSKEVSEEEGEEVNAEKTNQLNPRWLVPGTVHGGTNRTHEKARLRRGIPLLVCTPGRLLDHLEKTTALRLAGDPPRPKENQSKNPNHEPLGKQKEEETKEVIDPNLNLRWLVVDEADRLMDMGFEEQMKGILNHLTNREIKAISYWQSKKQEIHQRPKRRTILCSATMPEGVKKLVGLTLNDPITLKANETVTESTNDNLETLQPSKDSNNFSAPSQLTQHYLVTPPKLRLVSLIALLRKITNLKQNNQSEKILVFMSCTTSVDFHFEVFGGLNMSKDSNNDEINDQKEMNEEEREIESIQKSCQLLPNTKIFRLHGNLDLKTRLNSLKEFSKINDNQNSSSILFCTSLAGRGLDVPFVTNVIQYDLPTEGGINEYLHRIGRTARAGQLGKSFSFLLNHEIDWIKVCEETQNPNDQKTQKKDLIKLLQIGVEDILKTGFGNGNFEKDWENRATDVQMAIERWVIMNSENTALASKAFSSHIRAYATHPNQEKHIFNLKKLHLGHLAKSFGLRSSPKQISINYNPKDLLKPISKRQIKLSNRRNQTSIIEEDEEEEKDEENNRFVTLNQFKAKKNGNRLRGPITNTADEFNFGKVADLMMK
ncbi:hypothetical protein CROQUDRAFT_80273 [Cronartium quercuum f. sp. fusiforme G11]|uniref:ATP-dependent RNA helicase n=1 Tax=Cronartium quercuum f. sp. fusiforme G11 TaxID=708437 RepID=A0A9P6NHL5_9BASI|nr:hypothetical protein CROQUDRAFT_80273 [Cronartium quercuum f. sp. fusiforme G11]